MTDAFIFDHVRTPRGRGRPDGSLHEVTPVQLASQTLAALRDRNTLDTRLVEDVVLGCVMPVGEQGGNIARIAALNADYDLTAPGVQINRYCSSGLEAVNFAAAKVMSGQADVTVGGGVESMSRVPMGADGGAWAIDPQVAFKTYFVMQGISADLLATRGGFDRAALDAYSLESQKLKSKQAVDQASNTVANANNNRAAGLLKDSQSIDNASRQLDSARASYNTLIANDATKRKTPTEADYAQQALALLNAQNSLATAQKNLTNTQLLAPNDGTISVVNGKVGSAGSATSTTTTGTGGGNSSSPFVTLTDLSAFQVKVGFSETDATKIKAGQSATVSVDAVGARLNATVSSVDSSSTLVSNVVTYYAYLSIPTVPTTVTIQPGMTASVSVAVQKVDNVLYLPTSAVSSRGTTATVQVEKNKNDPKVTVPKEITIGLRGDTTLQILSGLNEGDVVVTTRTSVSTAASGQSNTGGTLTGNTQTGVGVGGATGGFTPGAGAGGATGGNGGGRTAGS